MTVDPIGRQMGYDGEGRVVSMYNPFTPAEYTYAYDGDGRRIMSRHTATGKRTVYVYDVFGRLAAEHSEFAVPSAGLQYRTEDHLGSTRAVTNAAGVVTAYYDFTPFGERILGGVGTRTSLWGVNSTFQQQFTGQYRDYESGFDYFNTRYLAAAMGRFLSPDLPLLDQHTTDPQSWNLYAYVRNNPLGLVDPTGRTCIVNDDGTRTTLDDGGETCAGVDADNARDVQNDPDSVESQVTESEPAFLETLFAPAVPRYVKNDRALSPHAEAAGRAIHDSFSFLPSICSFTVAADVGAPGGRVRGGGEYNTSRGLAFRGRAQGGAGPFRGRATVDSNGRVSTDLRVGGDVLGVTVGFTPDAKITAIGASANVGRIASVSISGQVGTAYSCPANFE